jgi:hypothetical protein
MHPKIARTARILQALPGMALLFGSTGCARATPEQTFWAWFESNEPALFDFEKDRERTFDRLTAEMHKVHPSLTFEFGPKENGHREFTISADGIREAFPKVEALYAAAPSLPQWRFLKFRQRRKPSDISYGGVTVQARTVAVQVNPDGPTRVDITVFFPRYPDAAERTYKTIMFLLLDDALGEYGVEMHVAAISVKPISQAPPQACSLEALPKVFGAFFAKR